MLGGLLGLAIHVAEVAVMDDPDYPLLLWLNVVLPAVLALAAWCLERRLRRVGAS
jgi:hypothetical protein